MTMSNHQTYVNLGKPLTEKLEIELGEYRVRQNTDRTLEITHNSQQFGVQIRIRMTDLYYSVFYKGPNKMERYYHYNIRIYTDDSRIIDLPLNKVAHGSRDVFQCIPTSLRKYRIVRISVVIRDSIFEVGSSKKLMLVVNNNNDTVLCSDCHLTGD